VNDAVEQRLTVTPFADDGTVGTGQTLTPSEDGIQESSQGLLRLTLGKSSSDYAAWWFSGDSALVEPLAGGTPTTPLRVSGGYAPALAASGDGTHIGVLAPASVSGPDLDFTLLTAAMTAPGATTRISTEGASPTTSSIAGGTGTFGLLWATASRVSFRAVTP
jgi:hypothetical protein